MKQQLPKFTVRAKRKGDKDETATELAVIGPFATQRDAEDHVRNLPPSRGVPNGLEVIPAESNEH